MKLKTDNPIPVKTRLKELFGDWLFISGYLIALFLLAIGFYNLVLGGIPAFLHSLKLRANFWIFLPQSFLYLSSLLG